MSSRRLNSVVALIGDLVGSRTSTDRGGLHRIVRAALDRTNADVQPLQPLTPTIGDEFQAVFATLDEALVATLLCRLRIPEPYDVRFGVGVGGVFSLRRGEPGPVPYEQDGPAWWAAREAIDLVAGYQRRRSEPRGTRTYVIDASARALPQPTLTGVADATDSARHANAFLLCRDHVISAMDGRNRRILLRLLERVPPLRIADEEGITLSAVSQRMARSGALAILAAHREIGWLAP